MLERARGRRWGVRCRPYGRNGRYGGRMWAVEEVLGLGLGMDRDAV